MKTRIAIGAALLLTLGSAVAGSYIYSQERAEASASPVMGSAAADNVTPEMIAHWKFTSNSSNYIAPRRPI